MEHTLDIWHYIYGTRFCWWYVSSNCDTDLHVLTTSSAGCSWLTFLMCPLIKVDRLFTNVCYSLLHWPHMAGINVDFMYLAFLLLQHYALQDMWHAVRLCFIVVGTLAGRELLAYRCELNEITKSNDKLRFNLNTSLRQFENGMWLLVYLKIKSKCDDDIVTYLASISCRCLMQCIYFHDTSRILLLKWKN